MRYQWRRRHAAASRRSFLSPTFPLVNNSISWGSAAVSHSCSVISSGSALTKDGIDDPAPEGVRPLAPAVIQDVSVVAAGVDQRVGQDRHAVEGAVLIDPASELDDEAVVPGEPARSDGDRAERVAGDVAEYLRQR